MGPNINFSVQENASDNAVRQCELDWPSVVEHLFTDVPVVPRKDKVLAWVPATFTHEGEGFRADKYVARVNCLVIDLDKGLSQTRYRALHDKIQAMGCAYLMHFTYSCHDAYKQHDEYKVRVVLPLSEGVHKAEWLDVWERARGLFADWQWDISCKNPSRLYYLPAAPNRKALDWMLENDWLQFDVTSPCLNIDTLRKTPKPAAARAAKHTPITSTPLSVIEGRLRELARTWKAQANNQSLGLAMEALLDGKEYSTEGARNPTMTSLAWRIAHEFPHHDAQHLAEVFRRSQDLMSAVHTTPADTLEVIADNIRRAQSKCLEGRAMMADKNQSRDARIVYSVTGVLDAEYRYTDEDRADMAARLSMPVETIDDRWVMLDPSGREFFLLTKKGIRGYFKNDDIWKTVYKQLLPTGIRLDVPKGKTGLLQPIPFGDFVAHHGTMLRGVAYDNRIDDFRMRDDGTLLLPVERSNLQPVYHEDVDTYLQALFGEQYEKARNWLAWMRDTSTPITACVLTGPADIGKTLFATGVSKLWAFRQPVTFQNAMEKFTNFDLSATPFVFADEKMPSNHSVTQKLREFVTTSEFIIEKKFASPYRLLGHLRLFIAANNLDKVLRFHKDDETEKTDLDALSQRLWIVTGQDDSRKFLLSVPPQERAAMAQHKIAEHALWLEAEHKSPRPPTRLAVVGSDNASEHMKLQDPNVRIICSLIMRTMKQGLRGDNPGIYWGGGYLRVTSAGIIQHQNWGDVTRSMPWTNPVAHIKKFGYKSSIRRDGKKVNAYSMDKNIFCTYVEELQGEDADYYRAMIDGPGN